jgi:hypothetical protein
MRFSAVWITRNGAAQAILGGRLLPLFEKHGRKADQANGGFGLRLGGAAIAGERCRVIAPTIQHAAESRMRLGEIRRKVNGAPITYARFRITAL